MKADRHKRISIKKKRRYATFKTLMTFMFILFMVVGSSFVVNKIIITNEIENLKNEESDNKDDFYKVINKVSDSIVTISDDKEKLENNVFNEGNVSGIILNEEGYILTSYKAIKGKDELYIRLSGVANEAVEAKFIGDEEKTDIAVLKISSNNLIPIKFADYNEIKIGQKVFAVGNAVSATPVGMITPGIITSIDEEIVDGNGNLYKVVETSAITNKKNLGGVLCDYRGKLIGFIGGCSVESNKENNLSYTLSVRGVKNICEYLINLTDILGINGGNAIDDPITGVKGVYIQNIKKDGYAANAGLLPTDIITDIDDKEVETPEDLYYAIKMNKNGDSIKCGFLRDGTKSSVIINLK